MCVFYKNSMTKFRAMKYLILICFFKYVYNYNVDVDNAIVYQMPQVHRSNFLGFSVALRSKIYGNSSWIVALGAPRLNDSSTSVESGGVYICHATGFCRQYYLDKESNIGLGAGQIQMTNSFIGVAMDIDQENRFAVCGHKITYIAHFIKNIDEFLSIGGCFVAHENAHGWIYPFKEKKDKNLFYLSNNTFKEDRAVGVAGMSASWASPAGGGGLVLGAPNVLLGTGSMTHQHFNGQSNDTLDINPRKYNTDVMRQLYQRFGYWGYSVATFTLNRKTMYLLGAPRANNLNGQAVVLHFKSRWTDPRQIATLKEINTYGAYFGASVAASDVNGDGNPDIVIGAPTYSDHHGIERGAIYIYIHSLTGPTNSISYNILMNITGSSRSHFGSCVAIPGDMDQDGFNDVFVGAPDEEGNGAVHIYYGQQSGELWREQVIFASYLNTGLEGFGISVSRGVDVDNNGYIDLAIGAYRSDSAVLLRGRPVVQVGCSTTVKEEIERNETALEFIICPFCKCNVTYTTCEINVKISLENHLKRATIKSWIIQEIKFSNVSTDRIKCQKSIIDVQAALKLLKFNEWKPLMFTIQSKLIPFKKVKAVHTVWNNGIKELNGLHAVASSDDSYFEKKLVKFSGDCGRDNICEVNLKSQCYITTGSKFVLGTQNQAVLQVNVSNSGEPSRETNLMFVMSGMSVSDIKEVTDCTCRESLLEVTCQCPLAYVDKDTVILKTVYVDLRNWADNIDKIVTINATVTTNGEQEQPENARCELAVELVSDASVRLKSSANKTVDMSGGIQHFNHTFEVVKKGHSPVKFHNLTVHTPVSICNIPVTQITFNEETSKFVVNAKCMRDIKRSIETHILLLQCGSQHVVCSSHAIIADSNTFLNLKMNFNTNIFSELKDVDVIEYVTSGVLEVSYPFDDNRLLKRNCYTTITRLSNRSGETKIWILSLMAGSLLLALVIPVLVKQGFFRRETKEKMDALKAEDFIRERFSMYEPFEIDDLAKASNRASVTSVKTLADNNDILPGQ